MTMDQPRRFCSSRDSLRDFAGPAQVLARYFAQHRVGCSDRSGFIGRQEFASFRDVEIGMQIGLTSARKTNPLGKRYDPRKAA